MNQTAGRRIATVTGFGSLITAGRGSDMRRGGGRHTTTVAGCGTAERGHGGPVQSGVRGFTVLSGRQRTYLSLDSGTELDLVSGLDGAASVGCQLGPVTASSPGGVGMAEGLA
jgi:hypothetical protein